MLDQRHYFKFFILLVFVLLILHPYSPVRLIMEKNLGLSFRPQEIHWQENGTIVTIKNLVSDTYRGKIMFVKVKDNKKIQIALAKNGLGSVETTSSMAKRTGAIAAVNGGGFFNKPLKGQQKNFPFHITIHNGQLISELEPKRVAIGISSEGKLVVDKNATPEQLIQRGVTEVVSFGPILIENGQATKETHRSPDPRSAIGQKQDGTFIFIVVDGRRNYWSAGISLFELQQVMLKNGAWTAVNLDGGGSATMVFKGKILNHPSDFTGERPIATSIVIYP